MTVTVKILRYNPEVSEESQWESYQVTGASRPTGCSTRCTRSSGTSTAR